jgi:hypothetical protein
MILKTVPSTAAHAILPGKERYPAPDDLNNKERELWEEVMGAMPAGWFSRENLPLLKMYVRHIFLSELMFDELNLILDAKSYREMGEDPPDLEEKKYANMILYNMDRQTKIVTQLAYHLRLTPKSRGEMYRKNDKAHRGNKRPWEDPDDEAPAA